MTVVAAILLAALSRAEIIERFRSPVLRQVDGLVEVHADCSRELRREHQTPVADFVSTVCRRLASAETKALGHFAVPAIVVHICGGVTNDTNVVVRVDRSAATPSTHLYLRSPAHADQGRLRTETVKAFYRAVKGEELDDEAALKALRSAIPELRIADEYADLAAWRSGDVGARELERYLKLMRSVLDPGRAHSEDVATFASRLYLYPPQFDLKFAGSYHECSFREAIALAAKDPCVRYAAFLKRNQLLLYGGGRGAEMFAAAQAYADFLMELARYRKSPAELEDLLDEADAQLKGVVQ